MKFMQRKWHVISAIFLSILFIVTTVRVVTLKASSAIEWNDLETVDIRGNEKYYQITDISEPRTTAYQTHRWSEVTADNRHFDSIMWNDSHEEWYLGKTRMMYMKKFAVNSGQTINIVAATEDDYNGNPGVSTNDGLVFYYSVLEFDADGNILFDGDWRDTSQSWRVGYEDNQTEYGSEGGLAPEVKSDDRKRDVAYIMIMFRLNNGDLSMGGGSADIYPDYVNEIFKNIYVAYNTFSYDFNANGGVFSDGTTQKTLERTGLADNTVDWIKDSNWGEPTRTGYTFSGWKVTSGDAQTETNKQYGLTLPSSAFSNGGFYSSLFNNNTPTATLYAQWTPNNYYVLYDNNWGNEADWGDGNGSVNIHWQTCIYDNTESIPANKYSKDGYVFAGWNSERDGSGTWYFADDTFINLTDENGGCEVLYAQWYRARSFVEYNGNGQTVGDNYIKGYWASDDESGSYDDSLAFIKEGYTFNAWSVYRQHGTYLGEKTSADHIQNIDGITTLTSKSNAGQCIEITDSNYNDYAAVGMGTLANDDNKRFAFEWAGKDENGDYYVIRSNTSGRVLDINSEIMDGDENKHDVRLRNYTEGSVFQQWYVEITDDSGYVKLRSRWNDGYLDNYNNQLYIYAGNDNDSQKWALNWIKFNAYAQWDKEGVSTYAYTVKHYFQNADGSYTADESITQKGEGAAGKTITGALAEIDDKLYTAPEEISITLTENEDKNVIVYYYDRATYTVTLKAGEGIQEVSQRSTTGAESSEEQAELSGGAAEIIKTYRWGETIQISAEVKAADETYTYMWKNWTGTDVMYTENTSAENQTASFEMPAMNVALTANATAALQNFNVTVKHYVMDTAGNYPDNPQKTETIIKAAGEELLLEDLKDTSLEEENIIAYAYGTLNDIEAVKATVTSNGVINLYYERKSYSVELSGDEGIDTDSLIGAGTYYAGAEVTVSAEVLEGYIWQGWTGYIDSNEKQMIFTMPSYSVELYASTQKISYTLIYDGNKGISVKNVPDAVTAQYGEVVQISSLIPERTGYCFNEWNTRSDGSGVSYKAGENAWDLTKGENYNITLYAQWQKRGFQFVKASSDRYNALFVKRMENDSSWYEKIGKCSAYEVMAEIDTKSIQIWNISKEGAITREK